MPVSSGTFAPSDGMRHGPLSAPNAADQDRSGACSLGGQAPKRSVLECDELGRSPVGPLPALPLARHCAHLKRSRQTRAN